MAALADVRHGRSLPGDWSIGRISRARIGARTRHSQCPTRSCGQQRSASSGAATATANAVARRYEAHGRQAGRAATSQVANVYRMTHQFKTAASYYQQSLDANPKNVGVRTDLASCLYYQGDVDGAIAQLEKSLTYDPKHAGTLFNLGIIRWKGKGDASGAVAAWQQLLKLNPSYENKPALEKLIADAKTHPGKPLPQSE